MTARAVAILGNGKYVITDPGVPNSSRIVEMIDIRRIEVHGLFDPAKTELPGEKLVVLARILRHGGDVVQSLDLVEHLELLCGFRSPGQDDAAFAALCRLPSKKRRDRLGKNSVLSVNSTRLSVITSSEYAAWEAAGSGPAERREELPYSELARATVRVYCPAEP